MECRSVRRIVYAAVAAGMLVSGFAVFGGCAATPGERRELLSAMAYYVEDDGMRDSGYFITDDSLRLMVRHYCMSDTDFDEDERYFLFFKNMEYAEEDVSIDLIGALEVYVSDMRICNVTGEVLEESVPAGVSAIWCTDKYLNMQFYAEPEALRDNVFAAMCPDTTIADAGSDVVDVYMVYVAGDGEGAEVCSFDMSEVLEMYPNVCTFRVMMKDRDVQYVDVPRFRGKDVMCGIMPAP